MSFTRFALALAAFAAAQSGFGQTSPAAIAEHAAARFLDQATWGPTPDSMWELQQMGINNWLQAQFALNTSDLPDQPILNALGKSNNNAGPVKEAFIQNTLTQPDQLRQRVAFVLSQIWIVSQQSVPAAYAYPPYWRLFRDNAFGNYRDIIKAVTLSPAMGRYLNMANNVKGNAAKGTAANENYARELMQLFTLGLTQLNPDGSPVLDSNKNPIPTYNQAIVTSMAKVLTGWTYPTAPGAAAKAVNPQYFIGQMYATEAEHDETAKPIFGNVTIPAGQTAEQDLESLLDALMAQPTMAPFVSKQLIEHLVTSNPSPTYIQRVSEVFSNNGQGVTGDMKAVITAILTDPEARAGDQPGNPVNPSFGHMREPLLFLSSTLRALNAATTAKSAIFNYSAELGEDLFNAPSVFSYFSPGYRLPSGLTAPEFQIYSTQTAADRNDIVTALAYGYFDGGNTTIDLSQLEQMAGDNTQLLDYLSQLLLHDSMSAALRQSATTAINAQTGAVAKTEAALYSVLTSGEYQIIQ